MLRAFRYTSEMEDLITIKALRAFKKKSTKSPVKPKYGRLIFFKVNHYGYYEQDILDFSIVSLL